MSKLKQVIAMGDGGMDGRSPFMDLYILAQANKPKPRVCFLGTASGDSEGYAKYFQHVFSRYPCIPTSHSFFQPRVTDLADFIMNQDVIYVGGGHTKSMLGVWREWGFDKILKQAYDNGVILSGGSAGSVCWFDECVTDSIPGSLTVMPCIGILPYSNCPHFASTSRRASFTKFVATGQIKGGYAADDFAALHFVDGEFFRGLSNRPYAKTFKLFMENGKLQQTRLNTKWLGLREYQEEFIFNTPMFETMRRNIDEDESDPES